MCPLSSRISSSLSSNYQGLVCQCPSSISQQSSYWGPVCQWSSSTSSLSSCYWGLMLLTTLKNTNICLERRYPLNPYPHCLLSCQRAVPLYRRRLVGGSGLLPGRLLSVISILAIWVVLHGPHLPFLNTSLILSKSSPSSRNMSIIHITTI